MFYEQLTTCSPAGGVSCRGFCICCNNRGILRSWSAACYVPSATKGSTCCLGRFADRSWDDCKLSQNSGVVRRASDKSQAVAGVMPRLPRTISLTRWTGMPTCLANAFCVNCHGSRNSLSKITPGCVTVLFEGINWPTPIISGNPWSAHHERLSRPREKLYASEYSLECCIDLENNLLMLLVCFLGVISYHQEFERRLWHQACARQAHVFDSAACVHSDWICHETDQMSFCRQMRWSSIHVNGYTGFMQYAWNHVTPRILAE